MSRKILFALGAVQTAALLFVGFRLAAVEDKIDGRRIAEAATLAESRAAAPNCATIADVQAALAPAALRPAPRVAALQSDAPRAPIAPMATVAPPSTVTVAEARSDFARYLAQGKMSAAEVDDFHSKLAELSQEDRRVMLRELTGAMNAGRLDARL